MKQRLAIKSVVAVYEVEPAIFAIDLILEDGETAELRINAFALQDLAQKLEPHRES